MNKNISGIFIPGGIGISLVGIGYWLLEFGWFVAGSVSLLIGFYFIGYQHGNSYPWIEKMTRKIK
jgi:hypothetical protein